MKKAALPKEFAPLLWSYRFSAIDPQEHKETIIMQAVNYGGWRHWQWIVHYYGRNEVRRVIKKIPVTAFGPQGLKLISLLLHIKKFNYAPRGVKPKYKGGVPENQWV